MLKIPKYHAYSPYLCLDPVPYIYLEFRMGIIIPKIYRVEVCFSSNISRYNSFPSMKLEYITSTPPHNVITYNLNSNEIK